jgi:hypothetical protein
MFRVWEDGRWHREDLLPEEDRVGGFLVESIPEPEQIEGKIPKLKVDSEQKQIYYEYVDKPVSPEEKIVQLEQEIATLESQLGV